MNVVDYVILGIVGVSLLFGLYRGFISSVLGLVCLFAAMFAAYAIGPSLAGTIQQNQTIVDTLVHYTDAASRLGDLDLSQLPVAGLDASTIADIVSRTNLPAPFDSLLSANMTQQVFARLGSVDVSAYINQTIVTGIVSIISYIVVFVVAYLALTLIAGLIGYVFRFPALKHLDAILGGAFGIVRGIFVVYVLFAIVPILMTILPFDEFGELIEASQLGNALYKSNIVTTILSGHL
ncbi:CvpA family protein [Eubacteriales bacterium OttesenSCG-928-A19]|nr:CvpA family protein [Eubacteriales bacterium OttesenSCG-928-A19]